jgi:hypothetical protein
MRHPYQAVGLVEVSAHVRNVINAIHATNAANVIQTNQNANAPISLLI